MRKNITDDGAKAIVEIHRLLKDCIIFENIEDRALICKNINLIKDYKKDVPEEMYSAIETFINDEIKPIVYDTNYFDFMIHEDFGEYNDEGHFVINSDRSLEMMIFLLYERTLELGEKLDEFASKHLYLNIK
ncbi:MAG: hypothetical protein PUF12_03715 [Thermoflexaceae bacterium]|nr:hypothetical protein [Thermoflexaceae bacterium]